MGILNPSGKIIGSGLTYPLRGYIDGLITANATDADHDITIAEGEATDSSKSTLMTLYSPLTKQIDATWAQGTNAGGLFAGVTLANTTWYHMFQIKHSSGAIDCGFDTSVTAANRPSGWNYYRRIGSVLTNGSANILAYLQIGDTYKWKTPIQDFFTTVGTAASLITLSTPLGIKTSPLFTYFGAVLAATAIQIYVSSPDETDNACSVPSVTHSSVSAGLVAFPTGPSITLFTNTSSQIRVRSNTASTTVYCGTAGYIDPRGKE